MGEKLLKMLASLQQERQHHRLKPSLNIHALIIDMIPYGLLAYPLHQLRHVVPIQIRHLRRLHLQPATCLKVDELGRSGAEVEIKFVAMVNGVEQQHLVLAVAQMAQRIEKSLFLVARNKDIGKNHHQRAPVQTLGKQMQALGKAGSALLTLTLRHRLMQHCVEHLH